MNIYRNTPNYYINRNTNSILRNKNPYFSTDKIRNNIILNTTYNKVNNYEGKFKTNLYNFNKNSSLKYNNKYYHNYYNHYNNMKNQNEIISTIKKSFERLKNKIGSLQKIIDENSIYDKNNTFNKEQNFKSIEKNNKSKNIYNNIYINIDKDDNKFLLYDNNCLDNNDKNNQLSNISPYEILNERKREIAKNDLIKIKSNKKSRSSNNIIISNFNGKINLKKSNLNGNKKNKLLNNINTFTFTKNYYLKDNYNQYNNIINDKSNNLNNNNLNIETNRIIKTTESENFSDFTNDLVNILQTNSSVCDTIPNLNKNNNNPMHNNKKIIEMQKSKENDFVLKSNISKVDEGINVRMSLNNSQQKKDDIKDEIKPINNKKMEFKISKERISIINNKKSDNNKNEKLSSDKNKVEKNFYKSRKISNNENKEKIYKTINLKNKENEKKIYKKLIINEKKRFSKNLIKVNKATNKMNKKENNKKEIINITDNTNLISKSNKKRFISNKNLLKNKIKTETNLLNRNKINLKTNGITSLKRNQKPTIKTRYNSKTNPLKNDIINKKSKIKENTIIKKNKTITLRNQEKISKNIKKIKKKYNIINNSNIKIKKQSTTSSEEKNEKLLNQIISETESKQKDKGQFHIKFNLENNTFIKYNQNDLINLCSYTDKQNKKIFHKQFDNKIYNEILKSKISLIPIIKKNYNINNFKINKNYKLNENLEEKEIIPDLYLENNNVDVKSLEKTLKRSIEKTFNKKYEKRKDENYMSYSDDTKEKNIGNENNIKIKGKNLFNEIKQLFQEDSQEEEEDEDKDNNDEDNFDNDDYIINDEGKESSINENSEAQISKEEEEIE